MEEINDDPFQITSADIRKVLHAGGFYMNRKRKHRDYIPGLPLPKHVCWVKSDIPSDDDSGTRDYSLESRVSENDSNSICEDTDSVMSVSNDWPSTSSVNWSGSCSDTRNISVDSKPVTELIAVEDQVRYVSSEYNLPNANYEGQLLEYGKYGDCEISECGYEGTVVCKGKEVEDLRYSDDLNEKNFILSSGRWNLNQEVEQDIKKMTIDKEFEQYFSTLML